MRQLISFLGRAQSQYRLARYEFRGREWPATRYFGLELARELRVDRLVLLGTASSMWDVLLGDHVGDELSEAHLELAESARAGTVQEAHLELLRPAVERALGRQVRLRLIGEARSAQEQGQILAGLAGLLEPGDEVELDVTHGYRHLAMLALAAVGYLRQVRRVIVRGLYYGALDMTRDGVTPVVELGGLAELLTWNEALAAHAASGDLGALTGSLERSGLDAHTIREWQKAAFAERNQDAAAAVAGIRRVRPRLEGLTAPAAALYLETLRARLGWAGEPTRSRQEWALGRQHLERGDYLRAAILLLEGLISGAVEAKGLDPSVRAHREEAAEALHAHQAFGRLAAIRHALAHAGANVKSVRGREAAELISDPRRLGPGLRRLADELETARLRNVVAGGEPA